MVYTWGADAPVRRVHLVAGAQGAPGGQPRLADVRDGHGRLPVRREHRRLGDDRGRPPAVDRPGAAADQGRQLAARDDGAGRRRRSSASRSSSPCSAASRSGSSCARSGKGADPADGASSRRPTSPTSRSPTRRPPPWTSTTASSRPSGSSSSRSCGSGSSCSRASTSASGMLMRTVGKTPQRAARAAPHDRPDVGRQRGVADHRRRRHVRRVPHVVRDDVLRLLPRALLRPRRADRPRRLVRVLGQGRPPGLALHLGVGDGHQLRPGGPALRRRVGEHRARRADRRPAGVHRQPLHAAEPLRPARRRHDAAALPLARRDLPDDAHRG